MGRYTCEGDARIAEDHMLFAGKRGSVQKRTEKTKDCGKTGDMELYQVGRQGADTHMLSS